MTLRSAAPVIIRARETPKRSTRERLSATRANLARFIGHACRFSVERACGIVEAFDGVLVTVAHEGRAVVYVVELADGRRATVAASRVAGVEVLGVQTSAHHVDGAPYRAQDGSAGPDGLEGQGTERARRRPRHVPAKGLFGAGRRAAGGPGDTGYRTMNPIRSGKSAAVPSTYGTGTPLPPPPLPLGAPRGRDGGTPHAPAPPLHLGIQNPPLPSPGAYPSPLAKKVGQRALDGASPLVVEVPVEARSPNRRGSHWAEARHRRGVRASVRAVLGRHVAPVLPVVVRLVRRGAGTLDGDNLVASFKSVRDEVARWLGVDDAAEGVRWAYGQERRVERRFIVGRERARVVYATSVVIEVRRCA